MSVGQIQVDPNVTQKVPKNNFAADFRAEKSQEGLHRKRNDRRCPIKLGPRILKVIVFEARRRLLLLSPHFHDITHYMLT